MTSLDAPDPIDRETLSQRLAGRFAAVPPAANGNGNLHRAAGNDITRLAEKFKAQGLDEAEVTYALINLNYSPAQVRKALGLKPKGKELVMSEAEKRPESNPSGTKWKLDIDWQKVQRDRDGGEKVTSIAKRLGCDISSVYMHTKSSPKNRVEKKTGPKTAKARPAAPNGNGRAWESGSSNAPKDGIDWAIGALMAKRDRIDQSIKTLEELRAGELA